MNLLLDKLPSKIKIGGIEIPINTDFRTSINFGILLEKYDLDNEKEKAKFYDEALKLYYPIWNLDFNKADDELKEIMNYCAKRVQEAIDGFLWFYRCGKEIKQDASEEGNRKPVYSFEHDGDKIVAAFKDQYNVSLPQEELHWWIFKAYFDSLKEDNEICKIISIRAKNLNDIKDKDMKEHYRKLQKLVAIPQSEQVIKENKKVNSIARMGGDLSQLLED